MRDTGHWTCRGVNTAGRKIKGKFSNLFFFAGYYVAAIGDEVVGTIAYFKQVCRFCRKGYAKFYALFCLV